MWPYALPSLKSNHLKFYKQIICLNKYLYTVLVVGYISTLKNFHGPKNKQCVQICLYEQPGFANKKFKIKIKNTSIYKVRATNFCNKLTHMSAGRTCFVYQSTSRTFGSTLLGAEKRTVTPQNSCFGM